MTDTAAASNWALVEVRPDEDNAAAWRTYVDLHPGPDSIDRALFDATAAWGAEPYAAGPRALMLRAGDGPRPTDDPNDPKARR